MKNILFSIVGLLGISAFSQTSYTIYDQIVFYDGYAATVDEPVPDGVVRINNARYTTKLSDEMVNNLSAGSLSLDVTIGALCDNYDRLGEIFLAMVPQGATEYDSDAVERIEIARIITPFMNKNINPTEVPYHFKLDNVAEIFNDATLNAEFDFWLEFEVFGVPYAAQTQVAGCAGRIDVFEGTLVFNVDEPTETYTNPHFLLPLSDYEILNNYNATDVPGETTKIINFTLDAPQENVVLYLISSNHGANAGGEEYERRKHYLYLDDELIHQYVPGGKSCEPWRQFNTQGNGIYGTVPKTTRQWLEFNNWCPGDKIPNREVVLGNLAAGNHTLKLDVPDAVFVGGEGYFPISMYLQNRKSGQIICKDPTDFVITEQIGNTITTNWTENGDAAEWEIMYGRRGVPSQELFLSDTDGETGYQLTDLTENWYYSLYVRSVCSDDLSSGWVGPIDSDRILATSDADLAKIQFYPNPVQDVLQIQSEKEIETVTILNMEGKKLKTETDTTINFSVYPAGNYLVIVKLKNGETITKKIMKR
ncbi:peptide-N-glycosidase F-related protein [Moheibacter lacus]|uniref:T9SS type A sorting domain-containing protein n=1 Tax=Moheibacter lacus TaxID=2745851 RepID=A0A838ZJR2_9FLAO|nr:peptide-N-glycosidase F-related protein [Moheibacter lacus]MBA5628604.1 T9SS type A sorting domain-containing protein [Moheibacter lacus]